MKKKAKPFAPKAFLTKAGHLEVHSSLLRRSARSTGDQKVRPVPPTA
jgi:hypothetical protein